MSGSTVAAAAQPAGAGGDTGEGGARQQNPIQSLGTLVLRMGVMYAFMMFMRSGKKDDGDLDQIGPRMTIRPFFQQGQPMDMQLYLSTSSVLPDKLLWSEESVPLAAKNFKELHSVTLTKDDLEPALVRNETMYLITRFALPGSPATPIRKAGVSFTNSIALTEFRAPAREEEGHSLLSGTGAKGDAEAVPSDGQEVKKPQLKDTLVGGTVESEPEAEGEATAELWLPHIKPNMTISMVEMFETQNLKSLPPHVDHNLQVSLNEEKYYPLIHFSEFWTLKHHLLELNETTEELTLHLELNTISNMYWTFMMAFQQSFDMHKGTGLMGEKQIDDLKTVFIEGNPYFLALTFVVSLLHSVFDMLAFKNDIGFWKSNKSMEGLSATTIIINACCQVVIFFYLLDNETSAVVLLSAGVGVLIEFWKITRVMDVTIEKTSAGLPKIKFAHRGSYVDTDTKKFDDEATRYMSYGLFPCVVGYFVYSLIYEKHKSWYSFVLQSLVGCVYTFGFVLMCPQLYLNYKLKSVAHLPWRQMTYKFLNTIIDDLFAFVIKMPLLHRLSVFRDDAVFMIYLYQRWIYRVDKTRVNEFGFSDQAPEEDTQSSIKPAAKSAAPTRLLEDKHGQSTAVDAAGATKRKAVTDKVAASATVAAADNAKDK